jgi:isoaspartyl peptidase/L-asparaginase-like protein (Ntn-hydrolase superfamily)
MMRRGFWLAAGAVLGVTGYRRATRLARMLTGQDRLVLTRQDAPALTRRPAVTDRPAVTYRPAVTRRLAVTRRRQDQRALAASELAAAELAAGPHEAGRRRDTATAAARSAIAGAAATAGFVRDVRKGMAEYRDLHHGDADRTLGSRSARALPGQSQQGRREP